MKKTIILLFSLFCCSFVSAAELKVPGHTAYLEPDRGGAGISADKGVTGWRDARTTITWYGQLKTTGTLKVSVSLRLPENSAGKLKLSLAGESNTVDVNGTGDFESVDFGEFPISESGYHAFQLSSLRGREHPLTDVASLIIAGEASGNANFNLKPRRNAASVHLAYPIERGTKVSAFYCEMTGLEDPVWSYYMACGWHRGYFGMQVNSPTERRIIFSVWDSGNEAVDRKKVADQDRVQLVAKGEDVFSGSFGNEGTGGHSHLKFQWKTGELQRFLVTAEPVDETHTIYAGYYFRRDKAEWMLISSWKAPKEGKYMRGLYSFSENFVGKNGHLIRKALYGNQWIRKADGTWQEITKATFSHDPTGKADRLDRFMGIEGNQFFLSHGGFTNGFTKYGTPYDRKPSGRSPEDLHLPALPRAVKE